MNEPGMREIVLTSEITVTPIQQMGGDHMIVAAARVSTSGPDALQYADESRRDEGAGLINYLMKHRHGTPFEHAALTFFCHAPLFVWREWHRHRTGFCLAGDSIIEFVDSNGVRAPGICRTIQELHDRWEYGEINGHATDQERLSYALELIHRGVSIRIASAKTGISRGTIDRHRNGVATRNYRGSRWRVEGMRIRVLNEDSHLFTHSHVDNVIESGIKELVRVTTEDGHSLRCSRDHRILTEDGWATAADLRKGDRVAVVGRRSKHSERQIPPSLRRGIGVWTSMQRNRLIREEDRCHVCGETLPRDELVLDHVTPVAADLLRALDAANLKPICETCNRVKTDGEQALALRGNVAGSKFVRLAATPTLCGEEMTYDLSVKGQWHNFVANGIVVHNSYNEESGRYKMLEPVFWIPRRERAMVVPPKHKPARPVYLPLEDDAVYDAMVERSRAVYQACYDAYLAEAEAGIALEVARRHLPLALYSSCWVTCNPRSLMHFLSLRTHDEAATFVSYPQAEIEEAARLAEAVFAAGWPLAYAAFVKNGRVGA